MLRDKRAGRLLRTLATNRKAWEARCLRGEAGGATQHPADAASAAEAEADTLLEGHDAFVFAALLGHHPEAAAKTAPGIARVGFGVNDEFPDTRSFFCVKTDGTKAGFSARKCVDALFPPPGGGGGAGAAGHKRPLPNFSRRAAAMRGRF